MEKEVDISKVKKEKKAPEALLTPAADISPGSTPPAQSIEGKFLIWF